MTLDLPSPTKIRDEKKRRLRALLDAELYLPTLVERLSVGFMSIDDEQACRWAGWIESLQKDPAWAIIEPALEMPEAWPDIWLRARKAGFSQTTDHHQAIFFTRLFERALEASRFELARRSWIDALRSWRALADGAFLQTQVLESVAGDLTESQKNQVLSSLLAGPLKSLRRLGLKSLRTESWSAPPGRRSLRFVLAALDKTRNIFSGVDDAALASGAVGGVEATQKRLHRAVIEATDRHLDELDLTTAPLEDFLFVFDGALLRCKHLDYPPAVDRALLRHGLSIIWDLRETGRDDELGIIPPMVTRLKPCTRRLRDAGDDDFLGLQGAVADLYVFEGEEALSIDDRQQAFESAIEVCPGHRNASRLLSYLLLERANRDLLKTAALPDATARLGPARRRIQSLIDGAAEYIERAEELYPDNDLLDRYSQDLREEIERFKLAPEANHED